MLRRTLYPAAPPGAVPQSPSGGQRRRAAVNKITIALIVVIVLFLYGGSLFVVGSNWFEAQEKADKAGEFLKKGKEYAEELTKKATDASNDLADKSEQLRLKEAENEGLKKRVQELEARAGSGGAGGGGNPAFPAGGGALLEDAVEFYRRVLQAQGDSANVARETARLYVWIAGFGYRERQFDKAEELVKEAVKLLQKVSFDQPDVPDVRQELAQAHSEHGNILHAAGDAKRLGEVVRAWNDGLAVQEKLVKDYPGVASYRQQLAEFYGNLGVVIQDDKKRREYLGLACAELDKLRKEFPKVVEYKSRLGVARANLAFAQSAAGLYKEADAGMDEALKLQREAVSANKHNPGYRQYLLEHYFLKAEMLAAHRRAHDQVDKTVREVMGLIPLYLPDLWTIYYESSVCFVRCLQIIELDQKLSAKERQKLTDFYTLKAVSMLRLAVPKASVQTASGGGLDPNLAERIQTDKRLDPLRDKDDFQKLMAELGLKS